MNNVAGSPFKDKVIEVVMSIPRGKVVSYGQVAAYIGAPRAARQVGWILRQIGPEVDIPWWRVINYKGRISIDGNMYADRSLQKKLLEADGVEISDFKVDMKKYRYIPDSSLLGKIQVSEKYAEKLAKLFKI